MVGWEDDQKLRKTAFDCPFSGVDGADLDRLRLYDPGPPVRHDGKRNAISLFSVYLLRRPVTSGHYRNCDGG